MGDNDATRDHEANVTAADLDDSELEPLDRLAQEFAARCRRGESPSIAEFEARYPDDASKIRNLLATVGMMEQLRRGSQAPGRSMPERLGEFRIVRELGRGGMGVVYEAVQESLGRHVALKVLHHIHPDAKSLQRFQREALAVAQLHHTNIVPIFGVGEHEGLPYYAMQYIQGSGLDDLLAGWREQGAPRREDRWRFAARVGAQAAEALGYAHDQGVLHRDIKPANLLIDPHQSIWITDFGLAKLTGHADLTASGDVIGTLRYLAPEALKGESDRRSDVYSLGLTLYELLTLSPPFSEMSPSELLRHVSEGEPIPPRRLDATIPRDLETIVLKAIAREPDHRYATALAMADDLKRFLEDRPIQARRATIPERIARWSRRNRGIAVLAATAAGSLLLALIVGWVGFARTMRALEKAEVATRRAEENEALSLEVFGELFDRLATRDPVLPPSLGQSNGSDRHGPGPPGRRPHPPGGDEEDPYGGPPPRDGGGPHGPPPEFGGGPHGPRDRPMGEPPGSRRPMDPEEDTALLRSVLTFYDRFAERNATNPRLQGEAAWAYRKVGALYDKLGRAEEAEKAYSRAIAMLEGLVSRFPSVPEYRYKLVETYEMADLWLADHSSLERLEPRLRRAQVLIDQVAAESPDDLDYLQAQVHVHAKLGAALQRLKKSEEAETCYQRAIGLGGNLIARSAGYDRPLMDRATTRESLAVLLFDGGRPDEARTVLDEAVADLESIAAGERIPPPLAARFESVARVYQRLGEEGRAEEMERRAEAVSRRPMHAPPGPPGRGPRQRRPAAPPP